MSDTGAAETHSASEQELWELLATVPDPEIPVVNIVELGIVRDITAQDDGRIQVSMTPTYTGCPATDAIRKDVERTIREAGIDNARIDLKLWPPWSTDCITPEAKEKLREYGIAPPKHSPDDRLEGAPCPRCGSTDTEVVSEFGSTPCKASMRCKSCLEAFDHFKCLRPL